MSTLILLICRFPESSWRRFLKFPERFVKRTNGLVAKTIGYFKDSFSILGGVAENFAGLVNPVFV
jgi:hypothetical protein